MLGSNSLIGISGLGLSSWAARSASSAPTVSSAILIAIPIIALIGFGLLSYLMED
ncbi:MAG: hypothetical protein LBL35_04525 [Clostridiales bacterium]|nr:hypothetical protein [Clostridiales bacterium]